MALGLGKVLACGQVRLPRDVRRAADIKPGDTVSFRVNNGVVEIRPPRMTLEESLKLFRIEGPADIAAMREEAEAAEADEVIRVMMRNTPLEILMSEGLLDTNVFVHAYTNDAHADECVRSWPPESGRLRARLDPLVLHDGYILMVLDWEGVEGEKAVMADAVERWRDTPGLGSSMPTWPPPRRLGKVPCSPRISAI